MIPPAALDFCVCMSTCVLMPRTEQSSLMMYQTIMFCSCFYNPSPSKVIYHLFNKHYWTPVRFRTLFFFGTRVPVISKSKVLVPTSLPSAGDNSWKTKYSIVGQMLKVGRRKLKHEKGTEDGWRDLIVEWLTREGDLAKVTGVGVLWDIFQSPGSVPEEVFSKVIHGAATFPSECSENAREQDVGASCLGRKPWCLPEESGPGRAQLCELRRGESFWEFLVSSKHSTNSFIISVSWIKAVRRGHVKIAKEQDNGCKRTKSRKPPSEWFQELPPGRGSVKREKLHFCIYGMTH